ncbi:MAG: lysostaphin resistance A-like protein [Planctomycetota bacterium]
MNQDAYPPLEERDRQRAWLALALLVPAPSLGALFLLWIWPGALGSAIWGVSKVWLLAFPLLWWRFVDKQRWSASPVRNGGLRVGAASGVVIAGAIAVTYIGFGEALVDPARLRTMASKNGLDQPATYLGLAVYLSFVNSLAEEYVWRWFVFTKCEKIMPRGAAVVAAGVFFMIHHTIALAAQFGWEITILGSVGTLIGGVAWSFLYLRYRSVWPGYVSHVLADLAVFAVGWDILGL